MISFFKHPILWIRKNIFRQAVMSPENLEEARKGTCQGFMEDNFPLLFRSEKYSNQSYQMVLISADISHEGYPWDRREYYYERFNGIFGRNTGTQHMVAVYEIKKGEDIKEEMLHRFEDDYFIFYKMDGVYYSEVFVRGEKHINSCKKLEEIPELVDKTTKLFFYKPKEG